MTESCKKIYIAGHDGLLGSAFLRRFKNDGYENIITASRAELELTDERAVFEYIEKMRPDVVVMAAGYVGGIKENSERPADFITQNLLIQLNLMRAAAKYDCESVLFYGSSCMYPRLCEQPMSEAALLTGALEPTSRAYAVAKIAGVQMCLALNQQLGRRCFLPLIPNTIYGPRDNFNPESGHVLPALIKRFDDATRGGMEEVTLWGSGKVRREFVYVDDVVDASLHIMQHKCDFADFPLNIGSGEDVEIAELAALIADVVGYKGKINWDTSMPDGAPRKLLDSARLKASGWQPGCSLAQGIASVYDWYQAHRVAEAGLA